MQNQSGEATVIIDTVERAELMSSIGREIERIDRQAASHGYTSWALFAAIGVLAWKALELIGEASPLEVGIIYLTLVIALLCARIPFRLFVRSSKGDYFRPVAFGTAGVARSAILACVAVVCVAVQLNRVQLGWFSFWAPILFFLLPCLALLATLVLPKVPMRDDIPPKGAGRLSVYLVLPLLFGIGVFSVLTLGASISWSSALAPSASLKVAVLSATITVLVTQLTKSLQVGERRTQFQRLETELALSKVNVQGAKERYENLMLGLNVTAAVRPWVDGVMLPLEEANAAVSEVKQLLVRIQKLEDAEGSEESQALDAAITQRIETLISTANLKFGDSGKAYRRLRQVCYTMFGELDLSRTPVSSEVDRIQESRRRFETALSEVREMAKAL